MSASTRSAPAAGGPGEPATGPAERAPTGRWPALDDRVLVMVQLSLIVVSALLQVALLGGVDRSVEAASAAERVRADIQYYDETLTMSCVAFAATGEARWRARYDRSAEALDAVLADATRLIGAEVAGPLRAVSAANGALLGMEAEAFQLTDAGQGPAAVELLSSPAYAAGKAAYGDALHKLRAHIDGSATRHRARVRILQGLAAVELLGVAALSGALWGIVRRRTLRAEERVQASRSAALDAAARAARALAAAGVGEVQLTAAGVTLTREAAALLRLDASVAWVALPTWSAALLDGEGEALAARLDRAPAGLVTELLRCPDGRHIELRGLLRHEVDGLTLDGVLVDVSVRVEAEGRYRQLVDALEATVQRRTGQLAAAMQRSRLLARSLQTWERQQAQRLAAVLHDDVQQALAAARLQVALGGDTALALSLLDHAIARVRSAAHTVASPASGLSLFEQLAGLREELRVHHGVRVQIEQGPGLAEVDPAAGQEVMAAARELLFNVRRHAGVEEAQVVVERVGDTLRLLVADRGVGFPVPRPGLGLGLRLLTARAEARGGEVALRARGTAAPAPRWRCAGRWGRPPRTTRPAPPGSPGSAEARRGEPRAAAGRPRRALSLRSPIADRRPRRAPDLPAPRLRPGPPRHGGCRPPGAPMPRTADPAAPPAVLIAGVDAADDPLLDGPFAEPGPLLPLCAADPGRALGLARQVAALQAEILRREREAAAAHAARLALHDVAGAATLIGFGLEHLAQTAAGLDPAARAALTAPLDELQAAAAHLRTLLHGRARSPPADPPGAPTASPAARGPDRVPVGELLERVARLMQRGLPPGVRLELDCGPELWAHVDPVDISRVLVNLVQNAAQALRERGGLGQIALRARADGEGVRIEVEDDGPGVPPSLQGRLFTAGATTRAAAGGRGLGLHLSRELARENAGWLEHQPGDAGARFVVWVPG